VEAARDLISEHGYGGFSLRTLAGTLGVRPAALYNHVRDRDDLLDAVAEQFVATFELPEGDAEWPEWVREVARGLRTHMRAQPHLTAVVLGRASAGPARPALLRRFMARLERAGVDPATAHAGWHALLHVVVGAVSLEDARERMPDDDELETTLELLIGGLLAAASRPPGQRAVALLRAHRGAPEGPV
jgi:AcrR family transcriptional regulator